MKKSKSKPFILTALTAVLIAAICAVCGLSAADTASASDDSDYGQYAFYYEEFNVTYDIKSNREIGVCEELTVHYKGYDSTGFMRDIPANGGELVRNVRVTEVKNGEETSVAYKVENYEDEYNNKYVTANIGSYSNKRGEIHNYRLYYTYCLTKAQEGANKLALNVIGPQDRRVESAEITLKLPEGFQGGTYAVGRVGTENSQEVTSSVIDGRTVICVTGVSLQHNEGISFELTFDEGALSTYFDFTPYWFVIAGAVFIILIFAVKFIVFNKDTLTPVVNFEAPEKMNPLMMGKLIDGTINTEDVTSMIFYWADKGYLKIDLENEKDPALIRIIQNLPAGTPAYEVTLFTEMFRGSDVVRPSTLKNRFYTTIDKVSLMVNSQVKGLHSKNSRTASLLFALFGGLFACAAPLIISMTQISLTFVSFMSLFAMIPLVFVYTMAQSLILNKLKSNKKNLAIFAVMIAFACLFAGLFYYVLTPSYIMGALPKILLIAIGCAAVICSAFIVCRTKEYTAQLNEIVGFRNFILLAEKDRLETMLEDNPQFYYHVLPYAQVLGVSDKWEEKFESITVEPPQWSTSSAVGNIIAFHALNRMINNSLNSMSANMGSRPSSSGGSGRGGFGGHVGGGHGGGGSRGR